MFKSVVEAGINALKSSMIINGGAAIALLAFIGNILKEPKASSVISVSCIGYALLIFVLGTGFGGTATGSRYLSQFFYSKALEKMLTGKEKSFSLYIGHIINFLTVTLGILSFAAFFYGGWLSV